ncbi:hypothetical protein EJ03DRAFT_142905 [Teratosphaeria nubilosa]|uniref:Uncharacterized protein n=1 Tax=Teratosphaeria nubilosa TaxID=161662 RepID=A0A6G1L4B5_9PEZI|nr:hypothetical protein EJ03DRAFT_142905 [Teratosphaeria nubilosa]
MSDRISSTHRFNHLFALSNPLYQDAVCASTRVKAICVSHVHLRAALLTMIAQEMTIRSDLYSMCLVSKDVKAVATPILYHTMEVTLGFLERNVHKVFDHGNEGLKHIRNLQIEPEDCVPWKTKYAPVFSKLLTALPKDRLHRSSILSSLEVVHEVNLLL